MPRLRLPSRRYRLLLAVSAVLLTSVFAFFRLTSSPVEAAWIDDSWAYRRKVTFTHNADISSERRVDFTFDSTTNYITAGKMQTDCDDVRFTDSSGNPARFQYVSGCNTASTVFDVVLPAISNGTNVFWMYYGNPGAVSASQNISSVTDLGVPNGGAPTLASEEKGTGPILYYSFDQGTDNTCSGGTNDVCNGGSGGTALDGAQSGMTTPSATSGWQPEDQCVSGKCLRFDATDDVVAVSSSETVTDDLGALTISAWIKADSAGEGGDVGRIVDKTTGIGPDNGFIFTFNSSGSLQFYVDYSGTNLFRSSANSTISLNKWNHVVVTWSGSSTATTIQLYVNGQEVAYQTTQNGTSSRNSDASSALRIGNDSTGAQTFDGTIDEVKIYNYVRTAAQIKTDFVRGASPEGASASFGVPSTRHLNDGLVGYWKFDESSWAGNCTTADIIDYSGNGRNGKACTDASNPPVTVSNGKYARGGDFDGVDNYANMGAGFNFTSSFTTAYWIALDDYNSCGPFGNSQHILGTHHKRISQAGNGRGWGTYWDCDGIAWELTSSDGDSIYSYGYAQPSPFPINGSWHHIVFVYDQTVPSATLYWDGKYLYSESGEASVTKNMFNNNEPLTVNGLPYVATIDGAPGLMDEVRIYNRNLSAAEVESLYNWSPGVIGHWKLDENTGTGSVNDSSGNSITATLNSITNDDWVVGKYGSALNLDGANDSVEAANSLLQISGDVSVSMWFKADTIANNEYLFAHSADGETQSVNNLYSLRWDTTSGNDLRYEHESGTGTNTENAFDVNLSAATWYHVEMVRDTAANTVNIYINGVRGGSTYSYTTDPDGGSGGEFSFGVRNPSTSPTGYFDGIIDDVKVYNYARTPKQVVEDLNGGHPAGGSPVASQLVYYKFDEQQGTAVNNFGSLSSLSTTFSGGSTNPTWKLPADCRINGCLDFDGSEDRVILVNSSSIDQNEGLASGLTFSAWINPDTVGESSAGQIFLKNTNTYCRLGGSSPFNLTCSQDLSTDATLTVNSAVPASAWTHIALSWTDDDDDEITIWINGRNKGSSTNGVGPPSADIQELTIGGASTNNFDGKIDEFKIYSSELTAAEIAADMNANSAIALGGVLGTQNNEGFGGNSPVAWWNFDQGSGQNVADISANNRDGILGVNSSVSTDDPAWVPGKTGSALAFDGTNDYVSIANGFGFTSSFSISAWAYLDNPSVNCGDYIINKAGGPSARDWTLVNDCGQFLIFVAPTLTTISGRYSQTILQANRWYHVTGVYDASVPVLNIYVDGKLDNGSTTGSAITSSIVNSGNAVDIGRRSSSSAYIQGKIDELKVYDYALTAAQVAYDFNRGGPVAWYKFDECQGTTAYNYVPDGSGRAAGMNATININGSDNTSAGTCSSGISTEAWNNGTTGKFNSAIDLDGSSDYVYTAEDDSYQASSLTLSMWIKPDTLPAASNLITREKDVSTKNFKTILNSGGQIDFHTYTACNSGINTLSTPTGIISTGQWYHVAFTLDHNVSKKIYINGRLLAETSSVASIPTGCGIQQTVIGASQREPTISFDGLIDDVRIYKYPLTADQIRKVYNENSAVRFGPNSGSP